MSTIPKRYVPRTGKADHSMTIGPALKVALSLVLLASTACGRNPAIDAEMDRELRRYEALVADLERVLDTFVESPEGDFAWLDAEKSAFAVRNGALFDLCEYKDVQASFDRSDGGSRLLLETRDPAIARNGLPYRMNKMEEDDGTVVYFKPLPLFEAANFGDCLFAAEHAFFGDGIWLIFVTAGE